MADRVASVEELAARIEAACTGPRHLVAIAGPPGSGKSTVAAALAQRIDASTVLPMDGFHLDDGILETLGLLPRKGAPETFDVGGLISLQSRLVRNEEDVIMAPSFDRDLEISRAGAIRIPRDVRILLVEGNYLLFDEGRWPELARDYSLTVQIDVPRDVLRDRLMARWTGLGFDAEAAAAKVDNNDLPNAQLVVERSRQANLTLG